ncbi:MAG: hypothetical protein H6618_02360 [Deltaproteobacteria bacterium]|nr:hypothetical protein [Deltaproteobacteria bacterium]
MVLYLKRMVVSVLSFACFISCGVDNGPQESQESQEKVWKYEYEHPTGHPLILHLADPDCAENGDVLADMEDVSVWMAVSDEDSLKIAPLHYSLHGFSGNGLSDHKTGVTAFYHHARVINSSYQGIQEQSARTPMKFCRRSYPRDSAENAALAVAVALKVGSDFYRALAPERSPGPFRVLMQPDYFYETKKNQSTLFRSRKPHNAYWMKNIRTGEESLLFMPLTSAEPDANRFWEQPAVAIHEQGHSLFYRIRSAAPFWRDRNDEEGTGIRYDKGLEEGFSDIFAWLAVRYAAMSEKMFEGEERLYLSASDWKTAANRLMSVYWHYTRNGARQKSFSHAFFSEEGADGLFGDDPHAIGAVFAHLFYKYLIFKEEESLLRYRYLGRFLLDWAERSFSDPVMIHEGEDPYFLLMQKAMTIFAEKVLRFYHSRLSETGREILCQSLAQDLDHFVHIDSLSDCRRVDAGEL